MSSIYSALQCSTAPLSWHQSSLRSTQHVFWPTMQSCLQSTKNLLDICSINILSFAALTPDAVSLSASNTIPAEERWLSGFPHLDQSQRGTDSLSASQSWPIGARHTFPHLGAGPRAASQPGTAAANHSRETSHTWERWHSGTRAVNRTSCFTVPREGPYLGLLLVESAY